MQHQLALLTFCDFRFLVFNAHEARRGSRHKAADGPGAPVFIERIDSSNRRRLRQSVSLNENAARQLLETFLDLDRKWRPA